MAIKFLQTSDWHLGAKLSQLPNDFADARRMKALDVIRNMISESIAHGINLAFLPGDLFDSSKPSFRVKSALKKILALFPKSVKVFIIPGTHDYYEKDGLWDDPDFSNIHIFRDENFSSVDLPDLGLTVWGVPVMARGRDKNWLIDPISVNPDRINLLLYHGDFRGTGREYEHWDYPFELIDLSSSPFDYIALGHHHRQNSISVDGQVKAAYSGSPFAWSFRKSELGDRKVILGEISENSISINLKPVNGPAIQNLEINPAKVADSSEKLELLAQFPTTDIVRIIIKGSDDPSGVRDKIAKYKSSFRYLIIEDYEDDVPEIEVMDNYHFNSLVTVLGKRLERGDIDSEFHLRLIERAKRIFS